MKNRTPSTHRHQLTNHPIPTMNVTDQANLASSMKLMKELEEIIICQYTTVHFEGLLFTSISQGTPHLRPKNPERPHLRGHRL